MRPARKEPKSGFDGADEKCASKPGSVSDNSSTYETVRRQAAIQSALAECAQALLVSHGEQRLEQALKALLTATRATYVFVERNVDHPELGLCSATVAEVEEDGHTGDEAHNQYWDLVPWERMPISRSHLEAGDPFIIVPDELEGPEFELYSADP